MTESRQRAACRLGFETQFLGSKKHLGAAKQAAIFGIFVGELFGGCGNVVEPRKHHQAGKAAIHGGRSTHSRVFICH